MPGTRRQRLPEGLTEAVIEGLSHDGRGIARPAGKTTFIDNALPGERVRFRYTFRRRRFDEGRAEEVLERSPHRVTPPCGHAGICGGCALQHLSPAEQLARKQAVLAEQLMHFGGLQPDRWLDPLVGETTGYRRRARLGVKHVAARQKVLVGFREKRNSLLADIESCPVLLPEVGLALGDLGRLLDGLEAKRRIPQIEVAAGDRDVALVFRHLDPLSSGDRAALADFCRRRGWQCWLQPGSESTMHRVWPEQGEPRLFYEHPGAGLTLGFHPSDFTQVNSGINRRMVPLALDLLAPGDGHRVLDLFCGLGNFTLAAARRAARVVGVEGNGEMVRRGYENARRNGLENVEFHAWDLTRPVTGQPWVAQGFDRILIDPPRTGALEILPQVGAMGAARVLYVSCNPATLARDAGELVKLGYRLVAAGVMDMFPHTTHVESIALFGQDKGKSRRRKT